MAARNDPIDPMWATFRQAHPEVTLVLLPDVRPEATLSPGGAVASDVAFDGPRESLEEARDVMTTLSRRLALIADVMRCADGARVTGGWQQQGEGLIRPQRQFRALATEQTPTDADMIVVRLTQLGWKATVRPDAALVWVEGTAQGAFARVTVVDGWVTVRMTGDVIAVDPADARELLGEHDV